MPESMYETIEDLLPVLKERLEMPKHNRFAKTSNKRTFEYIYVWQKKLKVENAHQIGEISTMYEIRASLVHGQGVFATENIPANTLLWHYEGEEMTLRDFKAQYGSDISCTYSLRRQNKIINGKNTWNLSHYCNESLTPNVILKKRALYTLEPISAGSEMFLRYPKNYLRDYKLSSSQ
jgi:SET domain-containing protein